MKGILVFFALLLHSVVYSQTSVGYINFERITDHPSYSKFYIEMDSINLGFEVYMDSLSQEISSSTLFNSCSMHNIDDSTLQIRNQIINELFTKHDSIMKCAFIEYEQNTDALVQEFDIQYTNDLFIFKHKYGFSEIIDDPVEYLYQDCTDVTGLFLNYLELRWENR